MRAASWESGAARKSVSATISEKNAGADSDSGSRSFSADTATFPLASQSTKSRHVAS